MIDGLCDGLIKFGFLMFRPKFNSKKKYNTDIEFSYRKVNSSGIFTFTIGFLFYCFFGVFTENTNIGFKIFGYLCNIFIIVRFVQFLYFKYFKKDKNNESSEFLRKATVNTIENNLNNFIKHNLFIKENSDNVIEYVTKILYRVLENGDLIIKIRLDGSRFNDKYKDVGENLSNLFVMRLKSYREVNGYMEYYLKSGDIDYFEFNQNAYGLVLKGVDDTHMPFNRELIWNFTKQPHALINGGTGGGKSYLLFFIIRNLVSIGAELFLIDPKKSDLSYLSVIGYDVAESKGEILKTLRIANEKMEQRYIDMKSNSNYRMGSNYSDLNLKPIFVIFDEFTAFSAILENKEKKEMESYLTNIVLKGRQAGVFIIIAMQRADANVLNANLRDNLGLRIAMGDLSADGYAMTFGQEFRNLKLTISDLIGNGSHSGCGFIYLDGSTSTPEEFYSPLMKDYDLIEDLKAFD